MTNYINNINDASIANTFFQTIEQHVIEKHLNKSEDVKLLVLKLDDLSADIINHLKEKKCNMMLLNNNFKIVERTDKKLIQLNINGVKQSVKIENIIHFEACGNYTYIHLENRLKPVLISRTLKYYVNLVPDSNFIRTHSKHLVNLKYVTNFFNENKARVNLANGNSIPISRRKLSYVKKVLLNK